MPSVAVPEAFVAIASATAAGVITTAAGDADDVYPGALAWLVKDDGSVRLRVKILSVKPAPDPTSDPDTITVRAYDDSPSATHSLSAATRAPSYGRVNVSAFNASSHLCQEIQTAPVDRAFQKRSLAG